MTTVIRLILYFEPTKSNISVNDRTDLSDLPYPSEFYPEFCETQSDTCLRVSIHDLV